MTLLRDVIEAEEIRLDRYIKALSHKNVMVNIFFSSLIRWTVVFRPKDPEDIEGIEKPIGMQVLSHEVPAIWTEVTLNIISNFSLRTSRPSRRTLRSS